MGIYDIETTVQELDDKIMAELTDDEIIEMPKEHPHRLISKLYSAMCRPQMTFNADYVGEYTKVLAYMDEFIEKYPEHKEMLKIRKEFGDFCAEEYSMTFAVVEE